MTSEIIAYIATGIVSVFMPIIAYYLRKSDKKIDTLNDQMVDSAIDLSSIKENLKNNDKDVSEIKLTIANIKDDLTRRLDKQFDMIIVTRDEMNRIKWQQENCTARKQANKKELG